MRNGDIMKTIGMAAAAFFVACGASAAHGAFERGGNTKDSSSDEIAKYEAVAGLPRDPNEKTVEPPKGMRTGILALRRSDGLASDRMNKRKWT